jgi:hypothetical protein
VHGFDFLLPILAIFRLLLSCTCYFCFCLNASFHGILCVLFMWREFYYVKWILHKKLLKKNAGCGRKHPWPVWIGLRLSMINLQGGQWF